jgi:ribonucleoside-diphosphate reductase alpha chain
MVFSKAAIELLRLKYCRDNETPEEVFTRVATVLGSDDDMVERFEEVMLSRKFLPNSPCIRNAGNSGMMKACFVIPIKDSIDSIFKTLNAAALIFKEGGGCGYNFSNLRQKGAPLSGGGTTSGVMSFIKIFDSITEAIKQGGFRKGASIGILWYNHPEIEEFITAKLDPTQLQNFNLSVMVNNNFMSKVENDDEVAIKDPNDRRRRLRTMKAKDLFNVIVMSAWKHGDPGLLFYDRINEDNIYRDKMPMDACNPCGEQPLLPYESCCLGSMNLNEHVVNGELDYDGIKNTIELGTQMLLNVNRINEFPVPECYKMQYKTNRIGVGIMGFADALVKLHIKYDSEETLQLIDKIGELMQDTAKKIAPTSASVLTIAPTGSLSIIASCSPSIEPIWSVDYQRQLSYGTITETRDDSEYIRTAHEVSPEWHLKIQAQWQKWIDSGVSKTVNLPYTATMNDVAEIYMQAWKMGCKGVTVFRDGCRGNGEQVFVSKCDGDNCYL